MTQAKQSVLPRGLFITFEGIDGSGKTLQAEILSNNLSERGHAVTLVRVAGRTAISEQIRGVLLDRRHLNMHPVTELFLYAAARSQLVTEIIHPALDRGEIVVSDRFTDSTVAYQGYGRGMDLDFLDSLNRFVTEGVQPDLVVLLDIDPDAGLTRKAGRKDRFEREDIAFHRKVREGYLAMAAADPERWLVVDASMPRKDIRDIIWKRVEPLVE